jgi:hypothetical protein
MWWIYGILSILQLRTAVFVSSKFRQICLLFIFLFFVLLTNLLLEKKNIWISGTGCLDSRIVVYYRLAVFNRIQSEHGSRGVAQRAQPLLGCSGNWTRQLSGRTRLRLKDQVNIQIYQSYTYLYIYISKKTIENSMRKKIQKCDKFEVTK